MSGFLRRAWDAAVIPAASPPMTISLSVDFSDVIKNLLSVFEA
jgi:hypothetical protein